MQEPHSIVLSYCFPIVPLKNSDVQVPNPAVWHLSTTMGLVRAQAAFHALYATLNTFVVEELLCVLCVLCVNIGMNMA